MLSGQHHTTLLDAPNAELYAQTRGGTARQYTQLVANIHRAVELGYRVRPCYLMSRVNTSREIMAEIVRFSADLGVTQMRLQRFKPWGGSEHLAGKYEFTQEEYRKISSFARGEATKYSGLEVIVPQNNRFLVIGSLYVYPDGTVAIQAEDRGKQEKLGNLRQTPLEEIWCGVRETYSKPHLRWLIRPKRLL